MIQNQTRAISKQKAVSWLDKMKIHQESPERIQLYHFYIVPMTRKTFSNSKAIHRSIIPGYLPPREDLSH